MTKKTCRHDRIGPYYCTAINNNNYIVALTWSTKIRNRFEIFLVKHDELEPDGPTMCFVNNRSNRPDPVIFDQGYDNCLRQAVSILSARSFTPPPKKKSKNCSQLNNSCRSYRDFVLLQFQYLFLIASTNAIVFWNFAFDDFRITPPDKYRTSKMSCRDLPTTKVYFQYCTA